MHFGTYKSHLEKMISQRNGYLVLAIGALVVCLLQAFILLGMYGKERIVLVPPTIEKSFWVSSKQVSPEYLSEMTQFFTYLRFNLTPENASLQRETLLRYVDSAYYNQLKSQLIQEADQLVAQHISLTFYPVNIKVNAPKLQVIIEGDLKTNVGDAFLPTKRVKYLIYYAFTGGRLLVKSFAMLEEVTNA